MEPLAEPVTASAARPSATGKERVVALDGLRAVALLIIMGFHFGVGWLQGGFFSLDIFYVLSGYLITGLLIGEFRKRRRIKLSAFWLRRARRLLPALLIVLVVVTLLVRFVAAPGTYPGYRMDALSALFYFSNWWQIAASGNYFNQTGAISPLTHTWSLSLEEQFYLVWPLVVLLVMRACSTFRRGVRSLLVLSAVGTVVSAVEMALLYKPNTDPTRLYFGTDTHAQSILIGACVACVLTLVQLRRGGEGMAPEAASPWARTTLVVCGLAGFAVTFVRSSRLTGNTPFDYRGGFAVSALSAAAVIVAAICVPRGPIARVLATRPLVLLGTISYGAYLWHFPVSVFVDPARTHTSGLSLLAIRFAITVVLAAASYRLVERPVMYGTFWRSVRSITPALAVMGVTVAVVVAGTVVPATAAPRIPTVMPAAEHAALAEAGAFTKHPIRFYLVGDSLAVTMGIGLEVDSVQRYGVKLIDKAVLGCDLDDLPTISTTNGAVDDPESACQAWPSLWAHQMAAFHPEVTGLLMGRWDILDHVYEGHLVNITQPAWYKHNEDEIEHAVEVLSSGGAHVLLFTMPYIDPINESIDGTLSPEDSPVRVRDFNRILTEVAARHPGVVTVVDLNRILDPHGQFQAAIDGITVRWADGIHISKPGGEWLQPILLPPVAESGLTFRATRTRG
jgi:peptidoglycan/LPS O-acetylase OafA/YrhL